jgi:transcriptional regulator with XRE-family HTH domain
VRSLCRSLHVVNMKMHKDVLFSERLAARRNRLNLTQPELAAKSGISTRSISDYERNLSKPSLEQLQKLAAALEISVGWLIGEVGADGGVLHDRPNFSYKTAPPPAPASPYAWMKPQTLDDTLVDFAQRLRHAGARERRQIVGSIHEVVGELAQREFNSALPSDAATLLMKAGASPKSGPAK